MELSWLNGWLSPSVISKWKGFFVAASYGVISISITFFNKAVFAVYDFKAPNMLTLGQIIFSLLFMRGLKDMGMLDYKPFNKELGKQLFPLAACFCGMVLTGLAALQWVNVPMFSALRRLTTFIVIAGQYFVLHKTVPADEFQSVVLMVIGAMVASWGDITFDPWGYTLTALNCIVTASYLVLISKKSKETKLDTFGLMYYNNVLSLPMVALIVMFTEWDVLMKFPLWWDWGFQVCFWMSSIQAFLLNYFVFLCSTLNSPLTTSITGQLKSIISTLLGLFMFGGVQLNLLMSVGLTMSSLGGIWYGQIKYNETTRNSANTPPRQETPAKDISTTNIAGIPPGDQLENGGSSPGTSRAATSSPYPVIHIDKMDGAKFPKEGDSPHLSVTNTSSPKLMYIAGAGKLH